jgi:hypothetical protein
MFMAEIPDSEKKIKELKASLKESKKAKNAALAKSDKGEAADPGTVQALLEAMLEMLADTQKAATGAMQWFKSKGVPTLKAIGKKLDQQKKANKARKANQPKKATKKNKASKSSKEPVEMKELGKTEDENQADQKSTKPKKGSSKKIRSKANTKTRGKGSKKAADQRSTKARGAGQKVTGKSAKAAENYDISDKENRVEMAVVGEAVEEKSTEEVSDEKVDNQASTEAKDNDNDAGSNNTENTSNKQELTGTNEVGQETTDSHTENNDAGQSTDIKEVEDQRDNRNKGLPQTMEMKNKVKIELGGNKQAEENTSGQTPAVEQTTPDSANTASSAPTPAPPMGG